MPYIARDARTRLAETNEPQDAGELNYLITLLVQRYLDRNGADTARYQDYNDAMGALEGAKMELYRRRIALYEDIKRDTNGEVYAQY